jgi:acid phosphatase
MRSKMLMAAGVVLAGIGLSGAERALAQVTDQNLAKIETIVVIYAENRSFDHLFGFFPGANGIAQATPEQKTQLDHDGTPLPHLTVFDHGKPAENYPKLPNAPFAIDKPPLSKTPGQVLPSPIHAFYHNKEQINGGRNNMFAAMSDRGGWVMGYFDGSGLKSWDWAKEYTLADNFFMGAFGGSYLNHLWLICACTPRFPDAPPGMRAVLDGEGKLKKRPESPSAADGAVQVYGPGQVDPGPEGFTVNTMQPPYQPSGIGPAAEGSLDYADPAGNDRGNIPLPAQTLPTIGDTLTAKGIGWVWYAGGWNVALEDGRRPAAEKRRVIYTREDGSPNFQPHHQPFNYFARFAPGSEDRASHLRDGEDFFRDIGAGSLPPVVFYKPVGILNQHPSYTDLARGDAHVAEVIEKLRASPQWEKMLVIVTYDENGGFWDHVPPPAGDRFGPGTRIPTLIVSPFAKRGFVDHTQYDTTSILKFITRRFGLEPLPGVRASMGDLTNALTFEERAPSR